MSSPAFRPLIPSRERKRGIDALHSWVGRLHIFVSDLDSNSNGVASIHHLNCSSVLRFTIAADLILHSQDECFPMVMESWGGWSGGVWNCRFLQTHILRAERASNIKLYCWKEPFQPAPHTPNRTEPKLLSRISTLSHVVYFNWNRVVVLKKGKDGGGFGEAMQSSAVHQEGAKMA